MKKVRKYGFGSIVLACVLALCMLTMFACGSVDVGSDPTTSEETKYSITVSDSIQNGSVDSSHGSTTAGTTITLDVSPSSGYELSSVSYNSTTITADASGAYTFAMPAENVTVTAEFTKISYDITIDSSITNGTVSVDKTSSVWDEEIAVTVAPASGYSLVVGSLKFNESLISYTSGSYSFAMPQADVIVTAQFAKAEFVVSVTGGTLVDGTTYGSFSSGDVVGLIPVIDAGKKFDGWYKMDSAGNYELLTTDASGNITVTEATNIVAVYSDIVYTVSVTGGTSDKASYTYGETATITPTGVSGSQFMYWIDENGNEYAGSASGVYSYTVMVEGNTFTAVYEEIPGYVGQTLYTVDAFGLPGSGSYYAGTTVDITFDYTVLDLELYGNYEYDDTTYGVVGFETSDGTQVTLDEGEIYSFTMGASNVTFTPIFGEVIFDVSTGVSLATTGAGEYTRGDSVTLYYDYSYSVFITFGGWIDVTGAFGEAGAIVSTRTTYVFEMPGCEVNLTPYEKLYSGSNATESGIDYDIIGIDSGNNWITVDRYYSSSAYTCAEVASYEVYFMAVNDDGSVGDIVATLQYVVDSSGYGYLQYVDDNGTVIDQVGGSNSKWSCDKAGSTAFAGSTTNVTESDAYVSDLLKQILGDAFDLTDSSKCTFYLGARLFATEESGIEDGDLYIKAGSTFTFTA